MNFIMYLSKVITPIILVSAILYGIFEMKDVFNIFIKGCLNGGKLVLNLFPILLALLIAVGMLDASGIIKSISSIIVRLLPFLEKYENILPFALLRPISGSSSTAIGTNLMQKFGTDSDIGILISLIMGSTETTIYVISVYGAKVKNKNIVPPLILGLIGDLICVMSAIFYFNFIHIF